MRHLKHKRAFGAAAVALAAGLVATSAVRHHLSAEATVANNPGVTMSVDLSQRKLYVRDGGDVVRAYTVAIGREGHQTPVGDYSIRKIIWNPAWIPPDSKWAQGKKPQAPGSASNPLQVVKIFFHEPDYYIHGTNDPESLGGAESHGCIRMDPSDAYDLAKYLMDNGGQQRDESWFDRVLHDRSESQTVYLDNSVPFHVQS